MAYCGIVAKADGFYVPLSCKAKEKAVRPEMCPLHQLYTISCEAVPQYVGICHSVNIARLLWPIGSGNAALCISWKLMFNGQIEHLMSRSMPDSPGICASPSNIDIAILRVIDVFFARGEPRTRPDDHALEDVSWSTSISATLLPKGAFKKVDYSQRYAAHARQPATLPALSADFFKFFIFLPR